MGRIWNCPYTTKSSPAARITLVPWASTTWEWVIMLTSTMMDRWVSFYTVMSTLRVLVRRVQTMWRHWLSKCCKNWIFFAKIQLAASWILCSITAPSKTKNNTVLKLPAWLMAMGYFKEKHFILIVVGHTKNAPDCPFNLLKQEYLKQNLFTFDELVLVANNPPNHGRELSQLQQATG